jgi:hypothetical protein
MFDMASLKETKMRAGARTRKFYQQNVPVVFGVIAITERGHAARV